jgi:hypothetical protein
MKVSAVSVRVFYDMRGQGAQLICQTSSEGASLTAFEPRTRSNRYDLDINEVRLFVEGLRTIVPKAEKLADEDAFMAPEGTKPNIIMSATIMGEPYREGVRFCFDGEGDEFKIIDLHAHDARMLAEEFEMQLIQF